MKQHLISTKQLKTYKVISLVIWLTLLGVVIALVLDTFEKGRIDWFRIYWIGYWGFGFYMLYVKRTLRLKSVAYDQENTYIIEQGQEVIIPFFEIKEIKLRSIFGIHSIQLYRNLGFGKEFFFKSSLYYPFNFKKVDNQVYELQKAIDKAKASYQDENYKALGS